MRRLVLATALLAGCDDLQGFGAVPEPLASISVRAVGEVDATGELRVALVWGSQWLPESFCFLPPESPEAAAVIAAGCRDILGFTPLRVAQGVAVSPGEVAQLELQQLPSADVMVGDVTARVAYGSFVLFSDVDGDGTLDLPRTSRLPSGGADGGPDENGAMEDELGDDERTDDIVHGASFVSMTEPDSRLAFREGGYVASGFYPRAGCGAPLPGFSVVSAGGFTLEEAVVATLAGELPSQDPATCVEEELATAVVDLAVRPTAEVQEVACRQRGSNSLVRYLDPPSEAPFDLATRTFACARIPQLGEQDPALAGIVQLVVANAPEGPCKGLTHYTLVGCDGGDLSCDVYEWDYRAKPPAWWPCPEAL